MAEPSFRRAARVAAWVLLLAVAVVTVSPVELRPLSPFGPEAERFGAFALLGVAFATAYPKRFWLVALLLAVTAGALEAMQLLAPTRHGTGRDVAVKLLGVAVGLGAGRLLALWAARRLGRP